MIVFELRFGLYLELKVRLDHPFLDLGSGSAFDAQKQFLANIEDAINSAVDLPSSIERYQSTLRYARSKLDFAVGYDLYLLPSNLDLEISPDITI